MALIFVILSFLSLPLLAQSPPANPWVAWVEAKTAEAASAAEARQAEEQRRLLLDRDTKLAVLRASWAALGPCAEVRAPAEEAKRAAYLYFSSIEWLKPTPEVKEAVDVWTALIHLCNELESAFPNPAGVP